MAARPRFTSLTADTRSCRAGFGRGARHGDGALGQNGADRWPGFYQTECSRVGPAQSDSGNPDGCFDLEQRAGHRLHPYRTLRSLAAVALATRERSTGAGLRIRLAIVPGSAPGVRRLVRCLYVAVVLADGDGAFPGADSCAGRFAGRRNALSDRVFGGKTFPGARWLCLPTTARAAPRGDSRQSGIFRLPRDTMSTLHPLSGLRTGATPAGCGIRRSQTSTARMSGS